jgi:membrane-bound metal-dependent hydrolase YbcI (DUF457 family)
MALAYLIAKPSAKILKVNLNIPLILVLSIIPDIDILFGVSELHRGPTHSIIAMLIIFIPIFAVYRKKAVPYFLALASHSLIADFLIGGQIMLFWPLTTQLFGLRELGLYIGIQSPINITLEWTLFIASTIIMYKTRDLHQFFQNKKSNLLLAIPIATVLLPTFASYPLQVPLLLMPPHLFYLVLFSISVLTVLAGFLKKADVASSAKHASSKSSISQQNLAPTNPYTYLAINAKKRGTR